MIEIWSALHRHPPSAVATSFEIAGATKTMRRGTAPIRSIRSRSFTAMNVLIEKSTILVLDRISSLNLKLVQPEHEHVRREARRETLAGAEILRGTVLELAA